MVESGVADGAGVAVNVADGVSEAVKVAGELSEVAVSAKVGVGKVTAGVAVTGNCAQAVSRTSKTKIRRSGYLALAFMGSFYPIFAAGAKKNSCHIIGQEFLISFRECCNPKRR
jgi:hypothetical protein